MTIDFVTFAADNYAGWLEHWLDSVSRSNRESRLFVYDVSSKPSAALARLAARFDNTQIIPWPESTWHSPAWVDGLDFSFLWPGFNLRDELKYLSRRLRYRLTGRRKHDWMIDKAKFVASKQFFIRICCQKPHIIRDAWTRSDRPLAYVDADAVVLERFSVYPGGDTDFAVTLVDPEQARIGGSWEPLGPDGPLPVALINAGVLFVNRCQGAKILLDAWIAEMSRVRHGGADQTALANLLYRNAPSFYETGEPARVVTAAGDALVAGLPCARYNQVRISRNSRGISDEAAIAHFVGSWKQPEHWPLVGEIIRQTWVRRGLLPKEPA